MKLFNTLFLLVFIFCSSATFAQDDPGSLNGAGIFKFDDELNGIFHDILTLRLKKATLRLNKVKSKNVFNLVPYYLEDYIDFLYAYIDGKPKDIYGKFLDHKENHLEWFKQGGEGDPFTLFMQADVHLRWGMIYAMFGDDIEAFKSLKKASALLDKNAKKFPGFIPGKRALAILHTMVSAIPGKHQWGGALSGLNDNANQGLAEMKQIIEHGKQYPEFEFNEEVQIIYGMLLLYLGNDDLNTWGAINTNVLDFTKNPMAAYILASKNLKTGRSRQAFIVLNQYPQSEEFYAMPYLDVLKGLCKLYQLDLKAENDFNNFLSKYRGANGIKEAYHNLAWISLLNNEEPKYRYYMGLVEKKGEYNTYQDKSAMNEMEKASQKIIPNVDLLKIRLLSEGGNYEKAYHLLEKFDTKKLKDEQEKIEISYRKAVVYHKMRKFTDALTFYAETIKKGAKKPYYFACNAALQSGIIWESKKDTEKAIEFYEICLKEKPDQYQTTLHSRARKKLNALKGKKKK